MSMASPGPTPSTFRRVMGAFPTGVTVLTAMVAQNPRGMTANSVTSLSLDPLLVLACVKRDGRFARTVADTREFAVNVLAEHQRGVAGWFASSRRFAAPDEFAGFDWRPSPYTDAPLLAGTAAYLDCRIVDLTTRGDHVVVFGEVVDCAADPDRDPLVWFGGNYRRLDRPGAHNGG
jgi:flavin reductase (DIM6/NTAB) family NADH-FMN oxidoreductase RutF